MPQEGMKIEEIPRDEKLRGTKLRRLPCVTESAGMALVWSRKLL
jgi:hypothetical protein